MTLLATDGAMKLPANFIKPSERCCMQTSSVIELKSVGTLENFVQVFENDQDVNIQSVFSRYKQNEYLQQNSWSTPCPFCLDKSKELVQLNIHLRIVSKSSTVAFSALSMRRDYLVWNEEAHQRRRRSTPNPAESIFSPQSTTENPARCAWWRIADIRCLSTGWLRRYCCYEINLLIKNISRVVHKGSVNLSSASANWPVQIFARCLNKMNIKTGVYLNFPGSWLMGPYKP